MQQDPRAGNRKLFALGAGLLVLLAGTIIVVAQEKPGELATIFITFGSSVVTMVTALMFGNAAEHKARGMAGAVNAVKALQSIILPADPKPPADDKTPDTAQT